MRERRAAALVEHRALTIIGRLVDHGVAEVPGLPADLRRLVADVRRTRELTDSGLCRLHEWRGLLFAEGPEQAAIEWLVRDRALQQRLGDWTEAHPFAATPPPALLAEHCRLGNEADSLLRAHPEFFDPAPPAPEDPPARDAANARREPPPSRSHG